MTSLSSPRHNREINARMLCDDAGKLEPPFLEFLMAANLTARNMLWSSAEWSLNAPF